jgi:Zn-dependent protease
VILAGLGLVRGGPLESSAAVLQGMMAIGVRLNMLLLAFNLLPIPPLDGSQVLKHLLPRAWILPYQRVGFYGLAILVLILYMAPRLLDYWLHPANVVTDALLDAVRPSVLPPAMRWIQ